MPLFKTLKYILQHPINKNQKVSALLRFIKWQVLSRIQTKNMIWPFIEGSHFFVKRGRHSLTANIYCGIDDFEEMGFMLHFLRLGDLFVDAGANMGSYTILAAAVNKAKVLAYEPVPSSYNELLKNVALNKIEDKVKAYNIGLGQKKETRRISVNLGPANQVTKSEKNSTTIQIDSLDHFTISEMPSFIKIDVQGYEWPILNGMKKTLAHPTLKAFVIEMDGSGKQYGYKDEAIHLFILEYGFTPYQYNPSTRKLVKQLTWVFPNTIYIRDLSFVEQRIKSAKSFSVFGQSF